MSDLPIIIQKKSLYQNTLECSFQNIHVSFINAIRRCILTDIPIFVFKAFPHADNKINIHKNTSRLNNEVLKQRFSCLPVHLTDFTVPYDQVEFVIQVSNTSPDMKFVTTDDIQVRQLPSEELLPSNRELIDKMNPKILFPRDPITKSPIVISRLKPKLNEDIPGEEIHLTATLSISSANENACFNVASTCSFSSTMDETAASLAWEQKNSNTQFETTEEETFDRANWMMLEGRRYTKQNQFEFILETIGIYANEMLVKTACKILVEQLIHIQQLEHLTIIDSESTMEHSKDIILTADFGIGKMLEYMIYREHFETVKDITYVSFYKKHPHDDESILRIALNPGTETTIETILTSTAIKVIDLLEKIANLF